MKINNVSSISNNNLTQNANLKNNNGNNNVAFKGNILKDLFSKEGLSNVLTLKRQGPMGRDLFIYNAFVFLLGTRFITSRDNNERRETLVRDVPSIILAVKGVPMFANACASQIQKMTGFAFMADPNKKSEGTASYGQLEDWYKYNKDLHSGFNGFCQRLVDQNGNLNKIFSYLNGDIKKDIKTLDKNNEFSDNKKFMNKLFDGSEESNALKGKLEELLSKDNKALKQASFLKTGSAMVGYAVTLGLLGIFIPKLNIAVTEKLNKDKEAKKQNAATAVKVS